MSPSSNSPEQHTCEPFEGYKALRAKRWQERKSHWSVPLSGFSMPDEIRHRHQAAFANGEGEGARETGIYYLQASMERLAAKHDEAVRRAFASGWVKEDLQLHEDDPLMPLSHEVMRATGDGANDRILAAYLKHAVEHALVDAHVMRIMRNTPENDIEKLVDMSDPTVWLAFDGLSSPMEDVGLIVKHPGLLKLEIAKKSHPLHFGGSEEMENDVLNALAEHGFTPVRPEINVPRYKKIPIEFGIPYPLEASGFKDQNPVAVIERKQCFATANTEFGILNAVERRRYFVRGDVYAAGNDIRLQRMIRNANRLPELAEKIEESLPYAVDGNPDMRWLQPISTQAYLYYVQ